MNLKINTKEKFTVLTPEETVITVNMAAELVDLLRGYLQKDIPHIVLNMKQVVQIEGNGGFLLAECQQLFYEQNCSFVICALQPAVENELDRQELLEQMNITPTESEAWDIVQMEEIERELLNDEEAD